MENRNGRFKKLKNRAIVIQINVKNSFGIIKIEDKNLFSSLQDDAKNINIVYSDAQWRCQYHPLVIIDPVNDYKENLNKIKIKIEGKLQVKYDTFFIYTSAITDYQLHEIWLSSFATCYVRRNIWINL